MGLKKGGKIRPLRLILKYAPRVNMKNQFEGENRRKHKRIHKNYILSYQIKGDPDSKYDVTQLHNISRGGMCFLATKYLAAGRDLIIELKTPYLKDPVIFEAKVIESREKIPNMIFEVRVIFDKISTQAEEVLHKLEQSIFTGEK